MLTKNDKVVVIAGDQELIGCEFTFMSPHGLCERHCFIHNDSHGEVIVAYADIEALSKPVEFELDELIEVSDNEDFSAHVTEGYFQSDASKSVHFKAGESAITVISAHTGHTLLYKYARKIQKHEIELDGVKYKISRERYEALQHELIKQT